MDALSVLSKSTASRFSNFPWKFLWPLTGLIFLVDLALPLGVAGGVPYILVILLSLRTRDPQLTIRAAVGCSLLTLLGIWLSPQGGEFWKVLVNRTFALFAIWTTALIGRLYLQQAETIFLSEKVFLASKDHISILDRNYRYRRVNPSYEEIHGKPAQEIVGTSVAHLLGEPTFNQTVKPMLDRSFQGEDVSYEAWFSFRDKERRYMAVTYLPLRNENNQIHEIVVISRDMTERQQAEEARKMSEEQLRDLYESAPLAYFSASFDGHIIRVNDRACELLGYSQSELIGKHVLALYAPNIKGYEKAKIIQKKTQGGISIQDEELQMITKNGDFLWVSLTVRLIYDEAGNIIERRGMVQDISHRKKIENELRISEYQYRSLVRTAGSIIIGLTPDGSIVEWNREAERLYGKIRQDALAMNYLESFIPENERLPILADIKRVLAGNPTRDFQNTVKTTGGEYRQISWNVDRLVQENQEPYGIICVGRDITDSVKAQTQLQKWAMIFQHTQWGVAVIRGESNIFEKVNEAFARMHGYAIREFEGMPVTQVLTPVSQSLFLKTLKDIQPEGYHSFEALQLRKDGTTFPALVTVSPIRNLNEQTLYRVANVIDISDRKHAEEALRQSEEKFRVIFEQAAVGVAQIASKTGEFVKINQRYCEIVGYSQEEMYARTFQDITHSDDLQLDLDQMDKLCAGDIGTFTLEKRYRRKNGTIVWVNLTVSPMWEPGEDPSFHIAIVEDITGRKALEEDIRKHNEELEKEIQRRTERIQELEQRRMQVEKLAALSQIAAGVAHEINNPLASISQSLLLLKKAIPEEHPNYHYMGKTEECIDRIAQITKNLYQLYRPTSPTPTRTDFRVPIQNAIEIMLTRASAKQLALSLVDVPTPIFSIFPAGELTQVLCNLIQNAIDASAQNDTITISIDNPPDSVSLKVTDRGKGIPPEICSHIFEPFFTTKQGQEEGGMGLGLAISHSLIQSMGGELDFTTAIGHGSTFQITLPRKDA